MNINIKQIPCSNYFAGRNGLAPKYVVLHGTAGGTSAEAIANYFVSTENTPNPVSSHYIIGTDGEIVQCVAESDGAWANGAITAGADPWWSSDVNPNNITISIEHCKALTDNSDALTPAQQASSFALIQAICEHWNIPKKRGDGGGGIVGHNSIDPVNRSNCPGIYPWADLDSYLANPQEGTAMPQVQLGAGIGAYFKDATNGGATTRWHCVEKNVDLIGANLEYWRSCNGILGLPLTNEIYDLAGAAIVVFERGVQINDPSHKYDSPPGAGPTYLMHLDKTEGQTLIAKPLVTALNTQITDLTAKVAQFEAEAKPSADLQAVIAALQTVVAQLSTASQATQTALAALKTPATAA